MRYGEEYWGARRQGKIGVRYGTGNVASSFKTEALPGDHLSLSQLPSLRRMRSSTGATRPPHDGEGDDGGVSHVHGRRKGRDRGQDLRRDIGDHRAALARAPSFKRRRADTA